MPIPQVVTTDEYFLECLARVGKIQYRSSDNGKGFEIAGQLARFHPDWMQITDQQFRAMINRLATYDDSDTGLVAKTIEELSELYYATKAKQARVKLTTVKITDRGRMHIA